MATLTGYAVKISWLGADHTYVKSSDGYSWGCWGRDSGGHAICSGSGSSSQANCISQPLSQAGILYGVTGVCHQTANRILWPCRAIVSGAAGYWASSLAYGTYGTDAAGWLVRIAACSILKGDRAAKAAVKSLARVPVAPPQAAGEKQFVKRVAALYEIEAAAPRTLKMAEKGKQGTEILGTELGVVLDYRLGKRAAKDVGADMRAVQQKLITQMDGLRKSLYTHAVTPVQYADMVNDAFGDALKRWNRLLGADGYAKLFGAAFEKPKPLVDRKIMAEVHK